MLRIKNGYIKEFFKEIYKDLNFIVGRQLYRDLDYWYFGKIIPSSQNL